MGMMESRKLESYLKLAIGLVLVVLLNLLAARFFYRFDLTEENRFTIKPATREMLRNLDDIVYVEVYLDGELNSGFKRLQRSIRETLEEFRVYSGNNIQYTFNDPSAAMSEQARGEFMRDLSNKGITPTRVIATSDGNRSEKLIFPGALISYGGEERGVMLLQGNQAGTAEEKLNQSIEGIEYALASTINELTTVQRLRIGMVRGHNELDSAEIISFERSASRMYDLEEIRLSSGVPANVSALVIAKPKTPFSENEKYHLDQYLMKGGKVLMLIDKLQASMDSASNEFNYAFPYELNLDDQLFKYGVRVNNDLVQDNSAAPYPIITGMMGDQPQIQLIEWPFFPIINRFGDHPVTRNLNAVLGRFVSTIDTVKAEGVQKTPLMLTSDYSRSVVAPVKVSIQDLRQNLTPDKLNKQNIPVAYLLEGTFNSLYANRFIPDGMDEETFVNKAVPGAKLLVVGDGDIIRNDVNPRTGEPLALGFDPINQQTYGNEDFLLNALNYMVEEGGLITARNKQIQIRPLDDVQIENETLKWQLLNLVLPVILIVLFGVLRHYWRKRKYTRFSNS
jgi:gliding-associated putative ABC transporter substrate-binding component GldG